MFDPHAVIQNIGPNQYIVRCGYCDLTGRQPATMEPDEGGSYLKFGTWTNDPCPICDGKGRLKVETDDIPIVDRRCKGTGHQPTTSPRSADNNLPCSTCQGLGVRALAGTMTILGHAPKLPTPPVTLRDLVIRKLAKQRPYEDDLYLARCAFCDGTGKAQTMELDANGRYLRFAGALNDEPCSECQGAGKIGLRVKGELAICPHCKGTGHHPATEAEAASKRCARCHGRGVTSPNGQVDSLSLDFLADRLR